MHACKALPDPSPRFLALQNGHGGAEGQQQALLAQLVQLQQQNNQLRQEKKRLLDVPPTQLEAGEACRRAAAVRIQACWRGRQLRQQYWL
jgi:hypothetical protein